MGEGNKEVFGDNAKRTVIGILVLSFFRLDLLKNRVGLYGFTTPL